MNKKGGGVAVVYKSVLELCSQGVDKYSTFEHMEVLLNTRNNCVRISVVYRPPSGSVPEFLEEFTQYIDGHTTTTGQLIIVGDFNLHYETSKDSNASKFLDVLLCMNLDQAVQECTMIKGTPWILL